MKTKKERTKNRQVVAIYQDQIDLIKPIADKNYRSLANQLRLIIDEWLKSQK